MYFSVCMCVIIVCAWCRLCTAIWEEPRAHVLTAHNYLYLQVEPCVKCLGEVSRMVEGKNETQLLQSKSVFFVG